MFIGSIIFSVVSFTIGVFLWSKYGIKRGSDKESYLN